MQGGYAEVTASDGRDLYDGITSFEDSVTSFALHSIGQLATPLNTRFFSKGNMDALQATMTAEATKSLGGIKISRQDDKVLLIIMRSIYMENVQSASAHASLDRQLGALNNAVLNTCVSMIVNNAKRHLQYLRDISKYPEPMPRAEHQSSAGKRTNSERALI